ncbi:MAG: ABC transporter ATP-binding protein [Candidatus Kapabacteria bacterium]|nr:ABC transporter ATP-binding protein [Candidatus Kapabacteria bacterium]
MITVEHLHKSFGNHTVLHDISFTMNSGSVTAVLGPNGSGKTTFMKCLLGLVRPQKGSITINGVHANGNGAYRSMLGYMPQIARFPENLTANEVFDMVRDIRGITETTENNLIDFFELREHCNKPLRSLSGGSRQKVSAVAALMFSPQVLLLDEPTAGLDPITSGRLKDYVLVQKQKGTTVVLTSHILSEVEELADHIIYLLDGTVYYNGTLTQLKATTGESTLERALASLLLTARATGVLN